jgi:transcriptional regulator with XRE-family HTH domain
VRINVYRTYQFKDKDPVIDALRVILEENGLDGKHKTVHEISGVSQATLHNWFKGNTKRPQYATISAVSSSLGYETTFVRARRIDVEAERKAASRWAKYQEDKQERLTKLGRKMSKAGKEARAMRKGA